MNPNELSDSLTPLSTGQPGVRSSIAVEARTPGRDTVPGVPDHGAVLDFISSDATLDRYGEIITPSGWRLDSYQRNPVFQNAHQYGDILFTLGRALITEVRSGDSTPHSAVRTPHLYQRIQFATDANPVARIAHALYAGGFLRAVSVGFIPLRWENGTAESGFKRKYLEQELLEVSAVSIPANPNALALALKSGALEKSDLKETADLINYTLSSRSGGRAADSAMETGPAGRVPGPQPLVALAHVLQRLLRKA
jgi:hypothetical protein